MGPRMRALSLVGLLLAGCGGARGGASAPASPDAGVASVAVPSAPTASSSPSARPTATASGTASTPLPASAFTPDDERIATLIEAGAAEAIPQLRRLNKSDPSKLVQLFEPLGAWIAEQEADVNGYTPSACTASAVTLYIDGIDAYDAIRKQFLAWKDWGAHGNAFAPGAPNQIVALLEEALDELGTHCHG
jgi:hypothetical protein